MSAWRRSPLIIAFVTSVVATVALLGWQRPAAGGAQEEDADLIAKGRELYLVGCVSCHGPEGEGAETPEGERRGPSLHGSGEAAAFYYLSTGRMPLANSEEQPERKEPAYSSEEIDALVAFVGSLGDGPELPEVDLDRANLAHGGELFRAECAACHSAAGIGGALSYGRAAPSVHSASPEESAAAIRVGPGQMPNFGEEALSNRDVDDVVAYVRYLASPADPGGADLGRAGPIPEGFVTWLFGMGALLLVTLWIGTRSPARRRRSG